MTEHENRSAGSAALRVVLRNDEEQYAIWPAARRIPAGWHRIAAPASAARCRSLVDDLWTDMRPLSVRAERHPTRSGSGTVPDMVRGQTRRKPSALAVLSDEGRLSYAELTDRVDRLAHELRQSGVAPESVVTVCLDRKPELVVALLAVLSSGGAFLPLDPATPRRRMAELMAKTRSRHVVSTHEYAPNFADCEATVMYPGVVGEPATQAPTVSPRPAPVPRPDDLAYVIYTSGSTGSPKGVMITHRSLAHSLTAAARAYELTPGDRVLHAAALGFDTSLEQIFAPLISGATLVLAGTPTWAPTDLLHRLPELGVTVADLTPTYWQQIVSVAHRADTLASLRLAIVGGEIVTAKDCRAVLRRFPRVRLVNAYGLTETTITSTLCNLDEEVLTAPDTAVAPVGRPMEGNHVHLLDAELRPVPPGRRGEIYIGGPGLARGIWEQPSTTAQQFLPDPHGAAPGDRMYRTGDLGRWRSDGNLEVLGRVDDEMKIRGFRVDPAEIEAALVSLPEIGQALVVARARDNGDRDLIAYYTTAPPTGSEAVLPARLRSALAEVLPRHMVPAAFHAVERLPVAPSGKLDRKALREPETTVTVADGDDGPVPQQMAQLWSQILGVEHVRPHDDFFELGGNSLLATEMLARARVIFGIGVTQIRDLTRSLLRQPVLAAFAESVRQARAGTLSRPEGGSVDFVAEGERPLPALGWGAPPPKPRHPGDVLLTGVTGFCGAHMIDELLSRTTGRILCLVRASDDQHAMERIRASHWRYVGRDLTSARVQPVVGDLGKPRLGLPQGRFEELASTIDGIYHLGGQVNFIYPYHELRPANVDGTYEIIRLAAHRAVPVHFTSSMAVLAGFGLAGVHEVTESTPLAFPENLSVGYVETKWVSEALLKRASDAGLPVTVYRLMDISGRSGTGVMNTSSEMAALFGFMARTGLCPDVPLPLDFLPADCLVRAIGHISTTVPARGGVYHLTNPRPTLLHSLAESLRRRGHPVQKIPYIEWIADLVRYAAGHPTDPITPFVPLFVDRSTHADITVSEMYFQGIFPEFTHANADQVLHDAGIAVPPVDDKMLDDQLAFVQQADFVRPMSSDEPGAARW